MLFDISNVQLFCALHQQGQLRMFILSGFEGCLYFDCVFFPCLCIKKKKKSFAHRSLCLSPTSLRFT